MHVTPNFVLLADQEAQISVVVPVKAQMLVNFVTFI